MPTYRVHRQALSQPTAKMKRRPTSRSTSIFDFDEGDIEPYNAKRSKFLEVFSKGNQCDKVRGENDRIRCKDQTERPSKRLIAGMRCRNTTAEETTANRTSSASDTIETDDSDSESNQARRQLDMRFGGADGVSSSEIFKNENHAVEGSRDIVLHGKELWFSNKKYGCSDFVFTADAVELKTQVFGAVRWPLLDIKQFRSGLDKEGCPFIELDLSEHGVEILQHHLGCSDDHFCHTIFSTISDIDVWPECIKQITSLSDPYKAVWKPGKENVRNYSEQVVDNILKDRDLCEQYLVSDCNMKDRNRAIMHDWCDLVYPTEADRDAVTVTRYDFLLLDPDQFLSDTIIDFYIKYLQSQLPDADKRRFYFYNSFFFRKLTEINKNSQNGLERSKSSFERVKRWTAGINIFDKDYLFIPIMQNAHWSLVIIWHPGYLSAGCPDTGDFKCPMILHLDSLEGCHTCVEGPIKSYLLEAWKKSNGHSEDSESIATLNFVALKVPQQTNYSDCGLFLLHYVELFIEEVLEKDSIDFASYEWFNPTDASRKRAHIQSLIQDLKVNKLAGGHIRPHQLWDMDAMKHLDLAQRPVSCGRSVYDMNKSTDNLPGNALYQDFSWGLVSCPQHNLDDMQLSAFTRQEHDYRERGGVEVVREPHELHVCSCCQRASCDELDNFFLQQAAGNHVQAILMPFSAHVDNCSQPSHCYVDDSLEHALSDNNLEDSYAHLTRPYNLPGEHAAGPVNGVVEENCTSKVPDSLVSNSIDAGLEVTFCCHRDDERILDMRFSSVGMFSGDEKLSGHVHNCSTMDSTLAEQARKDEGCIPVKRGSIVVQESKGWSSDSGRDARFHMEGKETIFTEVKDVERQYNPDYMDREVGMDALEIYPVNEVAAADTASERKLSKEGGTTASTDCRVYLLDTEAGGPPYCKSSDGELTSKVAMAVGDGKTEKARQRRNKHQERASMVRPVTRSSLKGKI